MCRMALQECGLNLDRGLKELQPHGTLEFPCAGYSARYTGQQRDGIPWHWHEELELLYVQEGALEWRTASETVLLRTGDLFAVNSNMLHAGRAPDFCELRSLVFHPSLLTGGEHSVFARRYIDPLIRCPAFTGFLFPEEGEREAADSFRRAFEAMEGEPDGYEFLVRDCLSRLTFQLIQTFQPQMDRPGAGQSLDNLRMRRMLEYIHQNYARELTLPDIARAADIGERECLRCFQKTIQCSPIQYLLKYRVTQGAELLLRHPERSVSELSLACGFGSPSNFAKQFRRFYRCTPREYRAAGER